MREKKINIFGVHLELTQKCLLNIFEYKDGILYWKTVYSNKNKVGDIAGNICNKTNYWRISFNYKTERRSRIIFLMHKGYLPDIVDHENHNTLDDRIDNLRAANQSQNMRNRSSAKNSTSKYLGVHFCKDRNQYQATIRGNKPHMYLGRFKNESDAALAYNRAAVMYHGEFANLNIVKP